MENQTEVDVQKRDREAIIVDYEYHLSDFELKELAERIAQLDAEEDAVLLEKKMVAAQWASKLKDTQTSRKMYSGIYRAKKEIRSEECYAEPDYRDEIMRFVSVDTGLTVQERPLMPEERQMRISDINNEVPEESTDDELESADLQSDSDV